MARARIEVGVVAEDRPPALDDEADQPFAEGQLRVEESVGPTAFGDERQHHSLVSVSFGDQDARNGNQVADRFDEPLEDLIELFTRE